MWDEGNRKRKRCYVCRQKVPYEQVNRDADASVPFFTETTGFSSAL